MNRVLTALIIAVALSASVAAEPTLLAPAYRFDFGITPSNTNLTHSFWLKSVGTDTVVIDQIKTGCSCAVSRLEQDTIPPGDSVQVGIAWDTKRMRGSLLRAPRIFFNGKEDPLMLQMNAQIFEFPDSARPVSIQPYRFEFARTGAINIDSIGFRLKNHSSQDITVELISQLPEQCRIELPATVPADGVAIGYVILNPAFEEAEFRTSLTLLMGDRNATHLTIPIRRKFY